jgi:hypothetical protein
MNSADKLSSEQVFEIIGRMPKDIISGDLHYSEARKTWMLACTQQEIPAKYACLIAEAMMLRYILNKRALVEFDTDRGLTEVKFIHVEDKNARFIGKIAWSEVFSDNPDLLESLAEGCRGILSWEGRVGFSLEKDEPNE